VVAMSVRTRVPRRVAAGVVSALIVFGAAVAASPSGGIAVGAPASCDRANDTPSKSCETAVKTGRSPRIRTAISEMHGLPR